jgi:hypothetical protein
MRTKGIVLGFIFIFAIGLATLHPYMTADADNEISEEKIEECKVIAVASGAGVVAGDDDMGWKLLEKRGVCTVLIERANGEKEELALVLPDDAKQLEEIKKINGKKVFIIGHDSNKVIIKEGKGDDLINTTIIKHGSGTTDLKLEELCKTADGKRCVIKTGDKNICIVKSDDGDTGEETKCVILDTQVLTDDMDSDDIHKKMIWIKKTGDGDGEEVVTISNTGDVRVLENCIKLADSNVKLSKEQIDRIMEKISENLPESEILTKELREKIEKAIQEASNEEIDSELNLELLDDPANKKIIIMKDVDHCVKIPGASQENLEWITEDTHETLRNGLKQYVTIQAETDLTAWELETFEREIRRLERALPEGAEFSNRIENRRVEVIIWVDSEISAEDQKNLQNAIERFVKRVKAGIEETDIQISRKTMIVAKDDDTVDKDVNVIIQKYKPGVDN